MKIKCPFPAKFNEVIAFGVHDTNLRLIERLTDVKIYLKENELIIEGMEENNSKAYQVIQKLFTLSNSNIPVSHEQIRILIEECESSGSFGLDQILHQGIIVSKKGNRIKPRTINQAIYINNILHHDLVFGIGPAGTGKTYLAVATGLYLLNINRINRIILTRPVIEAGESLGFLPGTIEEKIDPYLRPLFDALNDILSGEETKRMLENQIIEIAPLAYMRGRTLSNSLIILDEAQNTNTSQMKMFLTRLGENSKMVITGDITQIDLPYGKESGLKQAIELFKKVDDISFTYFEQNDIVRHGLVRKIIEIYEEKERKEWERINK